MPGEDKKLLDFKTFLNMELFFIVGLPRSGTTWVQHLLNHHPDIICRGESHFFNLLFPQVQQCFQNYNKEVLQQGGIIAHLKEYGGHVESLNYEVDDTHLVLLYCISLVFQKWIITDADNSALVLGEKTPDSILHLNLINSLLPQSKIIHVIRDGRDCATSNWFFNLSGMKNNRVPAESFEDFVSKEMKKWTTSINMAQAVGNNIGDRYTEVRYEELLDQPSIVMSRMLRFLGVDNDQEIIEKCIGNASFEKMGSGPSQGSENSTFFLRKGVSGDWKEHFNQDLSKQAWSIAGDLLESLGYPSS